MLFIRPCLICAATQAFVSLPNGNPMMYFNYIYLTWPPHREKKVACLYYMNIKYGETIANSR